MGATTNGLGASRVPLSITTAVLLLTILSTATARDLPFTGVVVDDKARTYCRAGGAYSTGELKKDELVKVEKVYAGWYQIVAPNDSYSFISKGFVDARGDGKVGSVNRDRAAVRAVNVKDKGNSYYTQVSLVRDTEVQILGRYGSFYMIKPPDGAYVYVRASSVERATRQQIEQAQKAAVKPPVAPDPVVIQPPPTPKTPVVEAPAPPVVEKTPVKPADPAPVVVATGPKDPVAPAVVPPPSIPIDLSANPESPVLVIKDPVDTEPSAGQVGTEPPVDPVVAKVDDPPVEPVTTPVIATPPPVSPPDSPSATVVQAPAESPPPVDVTPTVVATPPTEAAPPTAPVEPVVPQATSLADAEKRFEQASRLPLDQQPIEELHQIYMALSADPKLSEKDKTLIDSRLQQLHRRAIVTDTHQKVELARLHDPTAGSPSAAVEAAVAAAAKKGDTVGYLLASNVYNGDHLPRLYRVVDPATRRTIGYVRAEAPINPRTSLGRIVNLTGKTAWDRQLKVKLIKVERVEVLRLAQP